MTKKKRSLFEIRLDRFQNVDRGHIEDFKTERLIIITIYFLISSDNSCHEICRPCSSENRYFLQFL